MFALPWELTVTKPSEFLYWAPSALKKKKHKPHKNINLLLSPSEKEKKKAIQQVFHAESHLNVSCSLVTKTGLHSPLKNAQKISIFILDFTREDKRKAFELHF